MFGLGRSKEWLYALVLLIGPAFASPRVKAGVGLQLPQVIHQAERGVRAGDFVFIPYVAVEGRFTTNVFRASSSEGTTNAGILTVVPGFSLENPTPSFVKLSWKADANINQYFSKDENAKKQGRFGASTTLRADFLPRSVFGFFVLDRFERVNSPPNYSTTSNFDRNSNHAEAGIQIRPGSALEMDLSYAFNFDLFDDYGDGNVFYHQARFLFVWDLLPKTSLLLDADFRYMDWRKPTSGLRVNSMPLRVRAGMQGYITRKLAIVAKAGFGKGFYKEGQEFMNFIGEAGIGFKPFQTTMIEVGYLRDFYDSYYANWYSGDSARLTFQQQFANRVNLKIEGTYTFIKYASYNPAAQGATANQTSRKDHALKGVAEIDWSIVRYVSIALGYKFEGVFTDFVLTNTATGTRDEGKWMDHQAFVRLTLVY